MFFRLIKPLWAKPKLANEEVNPNFVEEVKGNNTYEGCFTDEFVNEKNKEGYNAYFFPNHPSKDVYKEKVKHLSGKHIDTFNYIFVDMDLKDEVYKDKESFYVKIKEFPIKPSMTVDSGNGVHVYWKISDLTREAYIILQLGLITHFKTDKSVWTVLQLLRVPGSLNTKRHGDYVQSKIVSELSSNDEYKLQDLPKHLFELSEELQKKAQIHLDKLEGRLQISFLHDVDLDELPENFISLMYDNNEVYKLFNNPKEHYGDRSGADMKLANILFNKDFNKKEALKVISNSQKALEKGSHRLNYAQHTIDKVYATRNTSKIEVLSVSEKLKRGTTKFRGELVNGPYFLDKEALGNPWRKTNICGIIAGSGVGKTTITLKMFKEMINNNIEINDDIYIFITLEMSEQEIIERWVKLVGEDSKLTNRLYVVGNEDDNGDPRNLGIQEIHEHCEHIKKITGRQIGSIAIDHIGIVGRHIDSKKKHLFGLNSEQNTGYGQIKTISLNMLCIQMKALAKMLNTFMIIQTQTTKAKGVGDLPIDKDGAKGISEYEHIMDYIITIWQPLMRVENQSNNRFLAWQYAKIRNKHKDDKIQTYQHKLLTYRLEDGELLAPTSSEYESFKAILPEAHEVRKNLDKKEVNEYSKTMDFNDIKKIAQSSIKNIRVV